MNIYTCVRDLSRNAGGVASVALPLHDEFQRCGQNAHLLYGISDRLISNAQRWSDLVGGEAYFQADAQATVVHAHGIWTGFDVQACRAAKRQKLPLVISPHGMLDPWSMAQKSWKKSLAWFLYQRGIMQQADLLIVNSSRELQHIRALGLKGAAAVIPNGVSLAGWSEGLGRRNRQKTVLFLSRLTAGKGLLQLLHAWAQVVDKQGFVLRIVGSGEQAFEAQLQALIEQLRLQDSVTLSGPLYGADKWQAYYDADYFILPSHSENFGIAVAEALYCGLPVITSDQTPWEVLETEQIGWRCGIAPEQIREALIKALSMQESQQLAMSVRAHEHAALFYNWPSIAEQYLQVYSWLLKGGAAPDYLDLLRP